MFGSPETTTGGRALCFYSSVRLDIRGIGAIKDSDEVIGRRTRIKVVKNKVAPPFREAEFDIIYNQGINRESSVLDVAQSYGVVQKRGAWIQYEGELVGQGKEYAKKTAYKNQGAEQTGQANETLHRSSEHVIRTNKQKDSDD